MLGTEIILLSNALRIAIGLLFSRRDPIGASRRILQAKGIAPTMRFKEGDVQ